MTERGIPKGAIQLEYLLAQRQEWAEEARSFFVAARHSTGMSQNAFAKEIGTSQSYVWEIERGEKTPSSGTLEKLRSIVEGEPSGNTNQGQEEED